MSAAAVTLVRPVQERQSGVNVVTAGVLGVMERLLVAAKHPDIVAVDRYGPGLGPWGPTVETSKVKRITGVKVTHPSSATASLWEAAWPGGEPVPAPTDVPMNRRATRLLVLTAQLLDYAKPELFRSWELLSLPGIGLPTEGHLPSGLGIVLSDGSKMLLRATATSPTVGRELAEDPFPDYTLPEGMSSVGVSIVSSAQ